MTQHKRDVLPILNIESFSRDEIDFHYVNDFRNHIATHQDQVTEPHKHDFFLFVLFTRGNGFHEIDFDRYEICPGSLFVICPGQTHSWTVSDDIDGYILFHAADQVFNKGSFPTGATTGFNQFSHLLLNTEELQRQEQLFQNLLQEYRGDNVFRNKMLVALIQVLHVEVLRIGYANSHKDTKENYRRIQQYNELITLIETHFITEKRPAFYADKMNFSIKHLNRITNQVIGKSTSQLIYERISVEAKRMLVHSDKTIKEIAYSLGFEDSAYFSRFFRKENNSTPKRFRQKYLGTV